MEPTSREDTDHDGPGRSRRRGTDHIPMLPISHSRSRTLSAASLDMQDRPSMMMLDETAENTGSRASLLSRRSSAYAGNNSLIPSGSDEEQEDSQSVRPPSDSTEYATLDWKPFFPQLDLDRKRSWFSNLRWKITQQHKMITLLIGLCFIVLIINMSWTIWAYKKFGHAVTGNGTLSTDSCTTIKHLNVGLHVVLNILSSILLGASNYCMQIVVAPSRREVNEAHKNGQWMDIGTQSIKNLRMIARKRKILWCSLGASSGLLHLVFNSAIFASIPTYQYPMAVVGSDFETNTSPWNPTEENGGPRVARLQDDWPSFERLENLDCIKRYANPLSYARDLVVVTNATSCPGQQSGTSLISGEIAGSDTVNWNYQQGWMCSFFYDRPGPSFCTVHLLSPSAENWTIALPCDLQVQYCLSKGIFPDDINCTLQYNFYVMIVVCVLTLVKIVCMVLVHNLDHKPLITIGDAIQSFLESPDDKTRGKCLLSRADVVGEQQRKDTYTSVREEGSEVRWYETASRRFVWTTSVLCTVVILVALGLFFMTLGNLKSKGIATKLSDIFARHLGEVSNITLMGGPFIEKQRWKGFFASLLFANFFQLLISCLYLLYNSMLTSFLVADEWASYNATAERKPLRVTRPVGFQESTYFLSLPYKYGVLALAASTMLHWLISQSVYVINTAAHDENGTHMITEDSTRVGFSSLGILVALTLGIVMVITLVCLGWFQKLPSGEAAMPLVSTYSVAISAACHRPAGDEASHLFPVSWGVVGSFSDEEQDGECGHCCITTCNGVITPQQGWTYR